MDRSWIMGSKGFNVSERQRSFSVKEIVHPKMKILSSSCCLNLHDFIFLWNTKENILKNVSVIWYLSHQWKLMGSSVVLDPTDFHYIDKFLWCSIQVWNNMRMSKWWQDFWVHCPFKYSRLYKINRWQEQNKVMDGGRNILLWDWQMEIVSH